MPEKDYAEATEVLTGDGETTVRDGGGALKAVHVSTDGTNAVTVEVYDGTIATGKKLMQVDIPAGNRSQTFNLPGRGVKFTNKLNVDVTGTGGSAFIYHGH